MRVFYLLTLFFLLVISCLNNPSNNSIPEITVTYPADGSIIKDSIYILTAVVDNVEITRVEFYIDGVLSYEDAQSPFTYKWIIQTEPGWHTILAIAYDNLDNYGLSGIVNVQVQDTNDVILPEIAITSPGAWSVVSDTVLIRTEVWDNHSVARVVFYIDGDSIGADITAPFQCSWNTFLYANDYHSIVAKAYDFALNWANAMITVRVNNPDSTDSEPPQIAITSPAGWSIVSDTVLVRTEVSDNRGVAKVVFYIDGDSLYTDLTPPFTYNWNSVSVPNNYHTILAKAYDYSMNWANALITVLVQNP
jgi:hypothetical protein